MTRTMTETFAQKFAFNRGYCDALDRGKYSPGRIINELTKEAYEVGYKSGLAAKAKIWAENHG